MRKIYQAPEMNVVQFVAEDIITASTVLASDNDFVFGTDFAPSNN